MVSTAVADVLQDYARPGLVEIASGVDDTIGALERVMARPAEPWLSRV